MKGVENRIRPVTMTALTAILGLLPAALSTKIGRQIATAAGHRRRGRHADDRLHVQSGAIALQPVWPPRSAGRRGDMHE